MKCESLKLLLITLMMLSCFSCANSGVEKVAAVNCNQQLSIVESSKNVVSKDGFTILYDGKNGDTLEKLLSVALENQIAAGCKKG